MNFYVFFLPNVIFNITHIQCICISTYIYAYVQLYMTYICVHTHQPIVNLLFYLFLFSNLLTLLFLLIIFSFVFLSSWYCYLYNFLNRLFNNLFHSWLFRQVIIKTYKSFLLTIMLGYFIGSHT